MGAEVISWPSPKWIGTGGQDVTTSTIMGNETKNFSVESGRESLIRVWGNPSSLGNGKNETVGENYNTLR